MPTINQIVRQGRAQVSYKSKSPILDKCPQKRGVYLSVTTTSPKKPNSAMRKIASEHPSEVVGEDIRKLYSWNGEDKLINN